VKSFADFEFSQVATAVEKLRVVPWASVAWVTVGSFILSSIVSVSLGYLMMDQSVMRPPAAKNTSQLSWSTEPTLNKLQVEKILERNLFNSAGLIGDSSTPQPAGEQILKTQLPVKLIGIIYGGDPQTGIATVENTEKKTVSSFLVGDLLAPDATVFEIHIDRIIIDNLGRQEFLPLEEVEIRRSSRNAKKTSKTNTPGSLTGSSYATDPPPDTYKEDGFERKGHAIEMSSEYKNRLLSVDFANVLQDAKASPNMVEGALRGWKMDRIRKSSIYEKAGVQNGDIIEEINGVILTDAGQAIKTLKSLRDESDIELRVNRGGKPITINFKVK
jgi:type II secretion system protein C